MPIPFSVPPDCSKTPAGARPIQGARQVPLPIGPNARADRARDDTKCYNRGDAADVHAALGGSQVPAAAPDAVSAGGGMLHLTAQQVRAVGLIAAGASDWAAAKAIGVPAITLTRWRRYHPHFRAELT